MQLNITHDLINQKKGVLNQLIMHLNKLIISSHDTEREILQSKKNKLFKQLYNIDMEIRKNIEQLGLKQSHFTELNKPMQPFLESLLNQEKEYFSLLNKTRSEIIKEMQTLNTKTQLKGYLKEPSIK